MPSISKMMEWVHNTCNDSNVHYALELNDDKYRYGYVRPVDGQYYFDCSSFVNFALNAGGWETPDYAPDHNPTTTASLPAVLESLGWKDIGDSPSIVSVGDIGHYYQGEMSNNSSHGHTEICYESGKANTAKWAGAHGTKQQVSEAGTKTWRRIYHWYGEDSETGATGDIPVYDISLEVISAICGNMWYESLGLNPNCWELSATQKIPTALNEGYGLGQWTNTGGDKYGRLYQLISYLDSMGYSRSSGVGQIAFLFYESWWNSSRSWQKFEGYDNFDDFIHTDEKDLDYLTEIYMRCWEGNGNNTLAERQAYTKQAYEYIADHKDDSSISSWYTGDNYLTDTQAYNNCVLVYRQIMNYANNVGTTTNIGGEQTKGVEGFIYDYTDAVYGYVNPISMSYSDLLNLFFANMGKQGNNKSNIKIKRGLRGKR